MRFFGKYITIKMTIFERYIFISVKSYFVYMFLVLGIFANAQTDTLFKRIKKHTIFLELGGQGGFYSIGYDHIYQTDAKLKKSFSIGLSVSPLPTELVSVPAMMYCVPLSINAVRFRYFEYGIGITPSVLQRTYTQFGSNSEYQLSPMFFITPKMGFRYQKDNGGLFFRVSVIPMIHLGTDYFNRITPWAGLSFGRSF